MMVKKRLAQIKTDKNGIATFTLTGTNASATPIVFLDGSYQEWDTKGGILPKTQDGRFDPQQNYLKKQQTLHSAEKNTLSLLKVQGGNYAAVYREREDAKLFRYTNGREYVITVKMQTVQHMLAVL